MNLTWKEALQDRRFVYLLFLSSASIVALGIFMPWYFGNVIAGKKGLLLDDVVLDWLAPGDWSWTIFTLVYSAMLITVVTNYLNPRVMLSALIAYSLVTWLRMATIYLFTLEAPAGMIVLADPFLSLIVYPEKFVKDLFFSGHVSSMVVFVLVEPRRWLRWLKTIATVIVGVLILIQHVHYTLDVVAAPLFSYAVYRIALRIQNASDKFR